MGCALGRSRNCRLKEPEGFDEWWLDMQAVADEGTAKLAETWVKSKPRIQAST